MNPFSIRRPCSVLTFWVAFSSSHHFIHGLTLATNYRTASSSLSSSSSSSAPESSIHDDDDDSSDPDSNNNNDNRRIFLGGLTTDCTAPLLRQRMETLFGLVQDISMVGLDETKGADEEDDPTTSFKTKKRNRRTPYAFVTFETPQSAQEAVNLTSSSLSSSPSSPSFQRVPPLYRQIQWAQPVDATKRPRSHASRQRQARERHERLQLCQSTNVILQVPSSHVERMVDFLEQLQQQPTNGPNDSNRRLEMASSTLTSASKNKGLIFLRSPHPTALVQRLAHDALVAEHVSQAYVVHPGAVADKEGSVQTALHELLASFDDGNKMNHQSSFRIHAFPPSLKSTVLSAVESFNNETDKRSLTRIRLDPRHHTHVLSLVQVHEYQGRTPATQQHNEDNLYMMGIASSSSFVERTAASETENGNDGAITDATICRAYYKLQEAIQRYQTDMDGQANLSLRLNADFFETATALDCGSAPGGWTHYLAVDQNCRWVYSVDPGALAPSVAALDNVQHLRLKLQEALPILREQQQQQQQQQDSPDATTGNQIRIFVSDMCLHDMSEQLDFLVLAKASGILDKKAFFVLTLKCTTGYSKQSFDAQVKQVLNRLSETLPTQGVATYHLFANRSGERTVMGFLV
mmetsp:Transcript_15189/g.33237  ORF Transcript_15189/g.33237 Transcript_15189/m.33237 type:complete len:634 (-) Transcript_15189:39-1940(-)